MELISREDAIKTMVAVIEQIEKTEEIQVVDRPCGWESIEAYVREIIDEIPTIESRPKGVWVEDTGLYATCSNCKENLYQAIEYKFCPNCGADMRGEE